MTVNFNNRTYAFRECDIKGRTPTEIQELTNKAGHLQYEPSATWLVVPGVGYGWEVTE